MAWPARKTNEKEFMMTANIIMCFYFFIFLCGRLQWPNAHKIGAKIHLLWESRFDLDGEPQFWERFYNDKFAAVMVFGLSVVWGCLCGLRMQ